MRDNDLVVENARLLFKNFSGEEGQYNPKGRRNFCIAFDQETAEQLIDDGWNIRFLKPRVDEDNPDAEDFEPLPYLQVAVSFDNYPPKAIAITSKGKRPIKEENIGMLDWVETDNVDVIINPYHWTVNGKSGVKAYLKSIYVTIREDPLEQKYSDIDMAPDSAASSIL